MRIRRLGRVAYEPTWRAMQRFTEERGPETEDELWLLEHPAVFTLGQNGHREHLLKTGNVPVIPIDRGGQITYHGPGQAVAYTLLDLRRLGIGVRTLVTRLEEAVVAVLSANGVSGTPRADAPGVYVDDAKIAAVGLRVRRGCSFHGVALNVAMDLAPFQWINPCGFAGLEVTDMTSLGAPITPEQASRALASALVARLSQQSKGPDRAPA